MFKKFTTVDDDHFQLQNGGNLAAESSREKFSGHRMQDPVEFLTERLLPPLMEGIPKFVDALLTSIAGVDPLARTAASAASAPAGDGGSGSDGEREFERGDQRIQKARAKWAPNGTVLWPQVLSKILR